MKIDDFLNNVEAKKAIKESMVSNQSGHCPPAFLPVYLSHTPHIGPVDCRPHTLVCMYQSDPDLAVTQT